MSYILLLIGFVLLIKGADYFVEGSASLAKKLKVPSIIIGLTIVAMGTSAPEAAVSISASLKGSNGIVFGNVIGSNIFNLAVVIGICSMIKPISVSKETLKSEYPISVLALIVMAFMSLDMLIFNKGGNIISRTDGIILLILMVLFILMQIKNALKGRRFCANCNKQY